ncbi:Cyclin-T1-5 [Wickerhamomyces ciferrii]|uniref:Cyclin-T1-5 n=1 Tax=Wickerhamomyces ciferrii (strain ATCC 14091 / BCRC 22168 / CBS 111 / JCM 3599 / NBRC 0793 / NRRL Y-1031 F-60-10) TaxID=1206466 RepID=K0KCL3_WICCF|nr:Cyclin-T1-5 [Wickerhamomyces ciferrii]CCH42805.1 Cyclin-T1-5 [Wickerhamomyces ciferrii]
MNDSIGYNNNHDGNVNPKFEDPSLYWQRNNKIDKNDWLYSLNDLNSSPSVKTQYGLKNELDRYRMSQDRIINACKMLNIGKAAIFCSMIYLQRFYQRYSMKEFSTTSISCACLYIACKKLEMHRNLKQLSAAYARIISGKFSRSEDIPEDILWKTRDDLEMNEDFVLATLCFDLKLTNPYQYIEDILNPKGYDYKLIKAFTISKIESLTTSQIFLIFKIEDIIITFLIFSSILKKIEFPIDHFKNLNLEINPEEILKIKELTKTIYQTHELNSTPLDDVLNLDIAEEDIVKVINGSLTSPPEPLPEPESDLQSQPSLQPNQQETSQPIQPNQVSDTTQLNPTLPKVTSQNNQNVSQLQPNETSAQIPKQIYTIDKKADSIESPKPVKDEISLPPHEEVQDSVKNVKVEKIETKPPNLGDSIKIDKAIKQENKPIDSTKVSKKENESTKLPPGSIGTKSKIFQTKSTFGRQNLNIPKSNSVFAKTKSPSPQKFINSPTRDSLKPSSSIKTEISSKPKETTTSKTSKVSKASTAVDSKINSPITRVSAPISRPKSPNTEPTTTKRVTRRKENDKESSPDSKPSRKLPVNIAQPHAKRSASSTNLSGKVPNKRQTTGERKSNAGRKSRKDKLQNILDSIDSDLSDLSD